MTTPSGFFASAAPVPRELTVNLASGETVKHTFYIRELSALDLRRQVLAEQSDDPETVVHALAKLIAMCVCNEDGSPAMTPEQAGQLRPGVSGQLRDVIMEVNGLGKSLSS